MQMLSYCKRIVTQNDKCLELERGKKNKFASDHCLKNKVFNSLFPAWHPVTKDMFDTKL